MTRKALSSIPVVFREAISVFLIVDAAGRDSKNTYADLFVHSVSLSTHCQKPVDRGASRVYSQFWLSCNLFVVEHSKKYDRFAVYCFVQLF